MSKIDLATSLAIKLLSSYHQVWTETNFITSLCKNWLCIIIEWENQSHFNDDSIIPDKYGHCRDWLFLSTESGNQADIKLLQWALCRDVHCSKSKGQITGKGEAPLLLYPAPWDLSELDLATSLAIKLLSSYHQFWTKINLIACVCKNWLCTMKRVTQSQYNDASIALYYWSHNRNWFCVTTESGNCAGIKLLLRFL